MVISIEFTKFSLPTQRILEKRGLQLATSCWEYWESALGRVPGRRGSNLPHRPGRPTRQGEIIEEFMELIAGWWLKYPNEKYDFVSWEYYSQTYLEKHVPNHQPVL